MRKYRLAAAMLTAAMLGGLLGGTVFATGAEPQTDSGASSIVDSEPSAPEPSSSDKPNSSEPDGSQPETPASEPSSSSAPPASEPSSSSYTEPSSYEEPSSSSVPSSSYQQYDPNEGTYDSKPPAVGTASLLPPTSADGASGSTDQNWDKLLENLNSATASNGITGFTFDDNSDTTTNDGGWMLWLGIGLIGLSVLGAAYLVYANFFSRNCPRKRLEAAQAARAAQARRQAPPSKRTGMKPKRPDDAGGAYGDGYRHTGQGIKPVPPPAQRTSPQAPAQAAQRPNQGPLPQAARQGQPGQRSQAAPRTSQAPRHMPPNHSQRPPQPQRPPVKGDDFWDKFFDK